MEPFAHDKAEGAKKVIVASSNSNAHGLKARPSRSSSSPRHSKNRATKSYGGAGNLNGSVSGLSWPSTPGLGLSSGNASSEKMPPGHYRTGSSFENSLAGTPGLGLSLGNASTEKIPLGHYRTGSGFENSLASTPGLGLSPGNASPEKIPLGHYRTRSSFENSFAGTPGLGLSPGNASSEKIPLGHYRTGSSFENSLPGMQLNSSGFLYDSNVAKFDAGPFSSVTSHPSQQLDVEEAMDIDHQEVNDDAGQEEGNSSEPGASEEKSLSGGESNNVSLDVSTKVQQ